MPLNQADVAAFQDILPQASILTPEDDAFASHTLPWSLGYNKSPQLAVVPSTVEQLQRLVKYLYDSDLDFAIRGCGTGSSSASDVILSLKGFQDVVFDEAKGWVDVGAGCDWGQVDDSLASQAPGYVVVGARCPYVGVAGSTLAGGLSWTSHSLGLGSDPKNLLDAHIVLADGRALWASEEPELLWSLRGGGGNFGVVTTLRLKAHAYTSEIFSGHIHFPASSLEILSERVSKWARTCHDPNMAMHIFVADMSKGGELHGELEAQLIAIIYDAHGEAHGRSDAGFNWALSIPGAKADVGAMKLSDVHNLQRDSGASHGTADSWLQAALIDDPDDECLIRAWKWYQDIAENEPQMIMGTFALLEIMQQPAFTSCGSTEATAWPHYRLGRKHVLQLSVGRNKGSKEDLDKVHEKALRILADAPARITGSAAPHPPGNFLPNFCLPNFDLPKLFEGNWERLRKVKGKYDPRNRFNKDGIKLGPTS